ncbi:MAG TPA: ABC transporter ATP-binding protein [Myxococcales bacterium]|nr:ABC transporter ATP-binding protein [Myxococcales bacterium]
MSTPLLEVKGVTKRFAGLTANDSVSFSVNEGEIVSIIGPNGAGKSTLFGCITGFHRPDAGEVIWAGRDITGFKADRVCRLGIARTFQIVQVIADMTVLENVMTGAFLRHPRRRDAQRRGLEVLESTGLAGRRDQQGSALTIADKKRLEVAMALATGPRLLMLDESMAGLTPVELQEIIALLRAVRKTGLTLVIVEHVMEAVMQLSDRVVVLTSGRKILEGTPAEVVSNPAVIQAYLGERYRA